MCLFFSDSAILSHLGSEIPANLRAYSDRDSGGPAFPNQLSRRLLASPRIPMRSAISGSRTGLKEKEQKAAISF